MGDMISSAMAISWVEAEMIWPMREAKQKFSALVQRTLDEGPQVITRRGEAVAVVISAWEYARLTHPAPDFADFLRWAPDLSALELDRAPDQARMIEL